MIHLMHHVCMIQSQVQVSRVVKRYMADHGLSQGELAQLIGLKQTTLSRRIRNESRWSLDDLDALVRVGVPVCVPFGVLVGDLA